MKTTKNLKTIDNNNYITSNNVVKIRDNLGVFQYSLDNSNWVDVKSSDEKSFVSVKDRGNVLPTSFTEGDYFLLSSESYKFSNTYDWNDYNILTCDMSFERLIPLSNDILIKSGNSLQMVKYYGTQYNTLYIDKLNTNDYNNGGKFFYHRYNVEIINSYYINNIVYIYGDRLSDVGSKITLFVQSDASKSKQYDVISKTFDSGYTQIEVDGSLSGYNNCSVQLAEFPNNTPFTHKLYKYESGNFVEQILTDGQLLYIQPETKMYLYKDFDLLYTEQTNDVKKYNVIGKSVYGKKAFLLNNNYVTQDVKITNYSSNISSYYNYKIDSRGSYSATISRDFSQNKIILSMISYYYDSAYSFGAFELDFDMYYIQSTYDYDIKFISDEYIAVILNNYGNNRLLVFKYNNNGIDSNFIYNEVISNANTSYIYKFVDNNFLIIYQDTTTYDFMFSYFNVENDVITNFSVVNCIFNTNSINELKFNNNYAVYRGIDNNYYLSKILVDSSGVITKESDVVLHMFNNGSNIKSFISLDITTLLFTISPASMGDFNNVYKIDLNNDYTIKDYTTFLNKNTLMLDLPILRNNNYVYISFLNYSNVMGIFIYEWKDNILKYLFYTEVSSNTEYVTHFYKVNNNFYIGYSNQGFYLRKVLDKYKSSYIIGAFLENKENDTVEILTDRFDYTNEGLITGTFYYYDVNNNEITPYGSGISIPYGMAISNNVIDRNYIIPAENGYALKSVTSDNALKLSGATFIESNMNVYSTNEIPSSYAIASKFQQKEFNVDFWGNLRGCKTVTECFNKIDNMSKILPVGYYDVGYVNGDAVKRDGDIFLNNKDGNYFMVNNKHWDRISNKFMKNVGIYNGYNKLNAGDVVFSDDYNTIYKGYLENNISLNNHIELSDETNIVNTTDLEYSYNNLIHYKDNLYIRVKVCSATLKCIADLIKFDYTDNTFKVISSSFVTLGSQVTYLKIFIRDYDLYVFIKEDGLFPRLVIFNVIDNNVTISVNHFMYNMNQTCVFDIIPFGNSWRDFLIVSNIGVFRYMFSGSVYVSNAYAYTIKNYPETDFDNVILHKSYSGFNIVITKNNKIYATEIFYNSNDGYDFYNPFTEVTGSYEISNTNKKLVLCHCNFNDGYVFYQNSNNKLSGLYLNYNSGVSGNAFEINDTDIQNKYWNIVNIDNNKYKLFYKHSSGNTYTSDIEIMYMNATVTNTQSFSENNIGLVSSIKFADDYSTQNSYTIFYSRNLGLSSMVMNNISATKKDNLKIEGIVLKDDIKYNESFEYVVSGYIYLQNYFGVAQKIYSNNFGKLTDVVTNYLVGEMFDNYTLKVNFNSSSGLKEIKLVDDTSIASASNEGKMRYRVSGNNSYVDICMKVGASSYAWVNIIQNSW